MRIFILQSKGGVGKSHLTKMLYYGAEKNKLPALFLDVDNESTSLAKFFNAIRDKKPPNIKYGNVLLVEKNDVVRMNFTNLIAYVTEQKNVVADFGAESSRHLQVFLSHPQYGQLMCKTLLDAKVKLLLVMGGDVMYSSCLDFYNKIKLIPYADELIRIVANEYYGLVGDDTVTAVCNAPITMQAIEDKDSSYAKNIALGLSEGKTYAELMTPFNFLQQHIFNQDIQSLYDNVIKFT